jgi:hypothetical protein
MMSVRVAMRVPGPMSMPMTMAVSVSMAVSSEEVSVPIPVRDHDSAHVVGDCHVDGRASERIGQSDIGLVTEQQPHARGIAQFGCHMQSRIPVNVLIVNRRLTGRVRQNRTHRLQI